MMYAEEKRKEKERVLKLKTLFKIGLALPPATSIASINLMASFTTSLE